MNKSESITKLAGALSKAQAEMPVVKMNAKNPFLKSKYADLGSVIETSRLTLAKYGLSVSQFPSSVGEQIGVTTILMHESGEYLEESIFIPTEDKKGLSIAQSAGLVISYLRRYGWASVLGLYADEDTDGHNQAEKKPEGNSDLITASAWDAWQELVKRADKVNINAMGVDRAKTTKTALRAAYKELLETVTNAEEQAKAGK